MVGPKIYDVSLMIQPEMLTWPGNPPVRIDSFKAISKGDSSNVSLLQFGSHSGTHVDAPRHFFSEAPGIDSLNLELLVGRCRLFWLPDIKSIDREALKGLELRGLSRVIFRTRNSELLKNKTIDNGFTFVTGDAADYLVEIGIKLIGVDYLSIDEYANKSRPAHHKLLSAGIVIIEGLDLSSVPEGDYELICLPLKIKAADAAPARVILKEIR